MILLTEDEILDAYASGETTEFLSGSRGIAKAQLKKVISWIKAQRKSENGDVMPSKEPKRYFYLVSEESIEALLKECE